jgi:1,4-alpha-glucan branching enzyme
MLYLDYSRSHGEWIPNRFGGNEHLDSVEFLKKLNAELHAHGAESYAEESTAWPGVSRPADAGGLGFTYKWNMGWMNDTLRYAAEEPINRSYHHHTVTFSLMYAFSEHFLLPLSHDEVVHGKGSLYERMPGDHWQKIAGLRSLYAYQWSHPGKKLLFMGCEFGVWREWNHADSLEWELLSKEPHAGLHRFVTDLNALYRRERSLYEVDFDYRGFSWIDCNDYESSVISFMRHARDPDDSVVVVLNWTPVVRRDYRVGVPAPGYYAEILNSDSAIYGGSNVGNAGGQATEAIEAHGNAQSLALALPPLAALVFKLTKN